MMTFREAMAHYRSGNANEEEKALVEEELEKSQLIAEYLDDQWEEEAAPEAGTDADAEIKQVRLRLCRRNAILVFTSLVLTVLLLVGAFCVVMPAVEARYWNPETNSFDTAHSKDLEMTLAAYSEVFGNGKSVVSVSSNRTGFASYELNIQYFDAFKGGDSGYVSASLVKNELSLPNDWLQTVPVNIMERASYPSYSMAEDTKADIYRSLRDLPDYVQVCAAVSFPEDLSMDELLDFSEKLGEGYVCWTGIRNADEDSQLLPLCGMSPFMGGVIREGINDDYPMFELKEAEKTAANLEQHFKSLISYLSDRQAEGTGIDTVREDYYDELNRYIEENGIYTYGCYLIASPQTIVDLLDEGTISQAFLEEAWIGL